VDGIKCRATGSGMTEEELRQLFASLNIDATTARGQVVAFALSCQGKFVYAQPSSLRGGPGSPSVGINLDCSSFVQYCYWAQNLPFSAGSTAAYRNAADLVSISTSEVQPGDLRVVYASGGEQGHVQMALGGDAWIECCYGYGVAVNMSNAWMESRPCYYFRYAGF
jgi:cell wall-associated NlpC family hydrolase